MEEIEKEWKKLRRNGRNLCRMEEIKEKLKKWKKLRRNGRK